MPDEGSRPGSNPSAAQAAGDDSAPSSSRPETLGVARRVLPRDEGPGSPRRRILFLGTSFAGLAAIVIAFRGVLLPFLFAVIVAYVLAPVVRHLERAMPRWVAVVVMYTGLLGGMAAFIGIGIPRLAVEVEKLAREVPDALHQTQTEWLPELERRFRDAMRSYGASSGGSPPTASDSDRPPTPDAIAIEPSPTGGFSLRLPPEGIRFEHRESGAFVLATEPRPREPRERDLTSTLRAALERQMRNTEDHAVTLFRTAQSVLTALVRGIFTFFIMLMLSAYLLVTSDRIFNFLKSLVRPERHERFDRLLKRIDRGLSGVVRGQLVIALVNGVLSGIGFYVFDLPYWPILTLIATVLSIVPIFGAILSSIPAVILALQGGITIALGVLAWIIGIHQLEANLLNPKIMGDSAKVHPVLVVFALLGGEHLFGIAGALLAVPILSILQSLFLHYREVALGVPGTKARTKASPA